MKKAYTIEQQIARLKSNGMTFDNEEKAKEILLDVGYYRLGFYSFPYEIKFPCLEHRDHKLKPGTTFKSVYDLYEFDTRLRRILLNALDRIEVNIRTKLIYNISLRYIDDPCWFVNRKYVTSKFVNDFEEQVYSALRKNPIIQHHHANHSGIYAPAWKTIEFMTIGNIITLYDSLKERKQKIWLPMHMVVQEVFFSIIWKPSESFATSVLTGDAFTVWISQKASNACLLTFLLIADTISKVA